MYPCSFLEAIFGGALHKLYDYLTKAGNSSATVPYGAVERICWKPPANTIEIPPVVKLFLLKSCSIRLPPMKSYKTWYHTRL